MLCYRVDGFEQLSLRQKLYVYYLSEAALSGRDILWHQNCRFNLPIRRMLEAVYLRYSGDRESDDFRHFEVYLKRVWFSNGIHHHYGCEKFRPDFSEQFFRDALVDVDYPVDEELLRVIFDPNFLPKRVNQDEGVDLLQTSSCNYYAPDITQEEAEAFYAQMKKEDDSHPVMYGMNSRLEKDDSGRLVERVWKSDGMYGATIRKIVGWLRKAQEVTENEQQREVIETLIRFYETGDLSTFDEYTILWVRQLEGTIDFTNGFTEVYGDPLGLKASWEGYVNIKDADATSRSEKLSRNAQWFEDHSPVSPEFKKLECRGIDARVVEVAMLGGDLYPSSAIGINLPNSNWVRQEHGSKSVTLGNLTKAYNEAAKGSGFYEEFVLPESLPMVKSKWAMDLDDLHTDLHECLGHGSGRMKTGVDADALKAYGSTIEEARADLFALYYIPDAKLVELGLTPNAEAYKGQYYTYLMNGLFTQLVRIELGRQIEEAHMRNRSLIAHWLLHHAPEAMQLEVIDGKTYLRIFDYEELRTHVGQLLTEVQRIKSEGDYEAARDLVEQYGVKIDAELHQEVLSRYKKLGIAPYKGFINPQFSLVRDENGQITDINITYGEAYADQMIRYGKTYSYEC
jgi:dipeptidyl-peptidase-3